MSDHKYGCLMAVIPANLSRQLNNWIHRSIDPDHLAPEGYTDEPHVTIKHGFVDGSPEQAESLVELLSNSGPFSITIDGISFFKGNEDGDVLKLDISSETLHKLNSLVSRSFKCRDKYPDYKPHLTLAYLDPKFSKQYESLKCPCAGLDVTIGELVYSAPDKTRTRISLMSNVGDRGSKSDKVEQVLEAEEARINASKPYYDTNMDRLSRGRRLDRVYDAWDEYRGINKTDASSGDVGSKSDKVSRDLEESFGEIHDAPNPHAVGRQRAQYEHDRDRKLEDIELAQMGLERTGDELRYFYGHRDSKSAPQYQSPPAPRDMKDRMDATNAVRQRARAEADEQRRQQYERFSNYADQVEELLSDEKAINPHTGKPDKVGEILWDNFSNKFEDWHADPTPENNQASVQAHRLVQEHRKKERAYLDSLNGKDDFKGLIRPSPFRNRKSLVPPCIKSKRPEQKAFPSMDPPPPERAPVQPRHDYHFMFAEGDEADLDNEDYENGGGYDGGSYTIPHIHKTDADIEAHRLKETEGWPYVEVQDLGVSRRHRDEQEEQDNKTLYRNRVKSLRRLYGSKTLSSTNVNLGGALVAPPAQGRIAKLKRNKNMAEQIIRRRDERDYGPDAFTDPPMILHREREDNRSRLWQQDLLEHERAAVHDASGKLRSTPQTREDYERNRARAITQQVNSRSDKEKQEHPGALDYVNMAVPKRVGEKSMGDSHRIADQLISGLAEAARDINKRRRVYKNPHRKSISIPCIAPSPFARQKAHDYENHSHFSKPYAWDMSDEDLKIEYDQLNNKISNHYRLADAAGGLTASHHESPYRGVTQTDDDWQGNPALNADAGRREVLARQLRLNARKRKREGTKAVDNTEEVLSGPETYRREWRQGKRPEREYHERPVLNEQGEQVGTDHIVTEKGKSPESYRENIRQNP